LFFIPFGFWFSFCIDRMTALYAVAVTLSAKPNRVFVGHVFLSEETGGSWGNCRRPLLLVLLLGSPKS
jgi:hypothetical protein